MAGEMDLELDEMQEIIGDFLIEADELITSLDTNLVKLEGASDDLDLLNEIFRAAHTIKGTSSFLGFDQVSGLTHKMEDILNKLRKAEISVTPEIMDLLLESLDTLKVLLENVRAGNTEEEVDLEPIIARLVAAAEGQAEAAPVSEASPVAAEVNEASGPVEAEPAESPAESPTESPTDKAADATVEEPSAPKQAASQPAGGPKVKVEKKVIEQTIRVDVDRLDSLMNLMGELVLGRNSLVQTVNRLGKDEEHHVELDDINRATASINYITTELQLAVMKMRMQPIGKVFGKFPRLVRDLTRESHKQIDLLISGEETELDKSVLEEIGDPLVHIIRNACDHGVESPEERKAKGKPEKGTVRLMAGQEGSNIVIKVRDDGKGLDVQAIRDKAVDRGLVGRNEVDRMPDREVFHFIFEPGFSTAKVVSDVSGRGVGMDVVRTNIEKLNGMIELESEKDAGTSISIKLPLTLAIIQGLLVDSDKEVFILPLASVLETVKTQQSEIYYVNQRPVLRLRDDIIPVINLNEILRGGMDGFIMTEKPYIVIVGLADKKLGINVDRFLGQEEVVIKSLGQYLGSTEGVAGATILGDGRIRLIVDLIGLFNLAKKLS